ncbi:MAG: HesA/MoeB/ThiF family protein [Promethearchaeota archaeon]
MVNYERYQRQIIEIGEENQQILQSKKVVQIGAGGLGSPIAYYLAAVGIGEILIVDSDTVSLSNLNRQILYTMEDLGKSKAEMAAQRLSRLNPDIKIKGIHASVNEKSIKDYCSDADYILDASDNMTTKFLVNDAGVNLNIPFTIAGVQSMVGQIISVEPHKSACYRCVFGEPDERIRDKPLPIFGFTAGVFGTMQVAETIKGLLGIGKRLLNRMMMIDLRSMEWTDIALKKDKNCMCSALD